MAATYSPAIRSTIGAVGLNFSVRNGKRWNTNAITTRMTDILNFSVGSAHVLSEPVPCIALIGNTTLGRHAKAARPQVSGN